MRLGLYGLPTAGKSFILSAVRNLEVLSGSSLLKEMRPDFQSLTEEDKVAVRKNLALKLKEKDFFIMDGHYSFGDNVVFTEEDGALYDTFLYLFVDPYIIKERMEDSIRNNKYLVYDIKKWQEFEIASLRKYCHENNKDFYVIDNPGKGFFPDISMVLNFIDSIVCGFSCVNYAQKCADKILKEKPEDTIILTDGDRTLSIEDSSGALGYKTHLFDGNFYTGFQSWRHAREMADYISLMECSWNEQGRLPVTLNADVADKLAGEAVVLTSGYFGIWKKIASELKLIIFHGEMMSAEAKFFITKYLQEAGRKVVAYGDSMIDYYMLKQADEGYLVKRADGSISRSLSGKSLEGIEYV